MTTANVTVAGDFRPIGPTGEGGKLGPRQVWALGTPSIAKYFFNVD